MLDSCSTLWRVRIVSTIACAAMLALPACRIPNLRNADAMPIVPAEFNVPIGTDSTPPVAALVGGMAIATQPNGSSSSENSGRLGIAEFYNDATLVQLIDQAIAGNRELKILDEEVQIASNEIMARRGAYLPFLTAGGSAGFEKTSRYTRNGAVEEGLPILPDQPFPNPLPNYMGGLNLFWELDIWRKLRNARDAAAARYTAAIEKRNYFATTLVAEVAEKYYNLMALDQRIVTLNQTIELQQQSLSISIAKKDAGRGTELAVQRFQAEVNKNQSEKLIVRQDIVEAENRINFLLNRFPEPVPRSSVGFYDLTIHDLSVGTPAELLQNRADIRQAERELTATGLDILVARAAFYPSVSITAGLGTQIFNPRYIVNPQALAADLTGHIVAPLLNKKAIRADFMSANARQLQSLYNYQRVILNAFTEVYNRVTMAENYRKSIEIKKQQLQALEASVDTASKLFQNARAEYIEVLFAQRDLLEARTVMIETKKQQLTAIVNAYQALGGGYALPIPVPIPVPTR